MKKIILIFTLLICSISTFLKAQTLDVKWTDRMIYDNKLDGFFEDFVGNNSKFVYAKFNKLTLRMNKNADKVKLVAFDKNTMKKAGETTMMDSKDPGSAKNYKDLKYYKTIVFENLIYVFWKKESKTKVELFVQTYDSKLKPVQKVKKIYELNSDSKDSKKAEVFVMANEKVNESIVIGGELAAGKGSNVTVEYKVLKSDLSFSSANQVALPVSVSGKSKSLTSSYEYGDDGNLHIKTYVTMDKEQRKTAKKGEAYRYPIYSVVKLETGNIQSYTIKFENKNVFDFDFEVTKGAIKIFGFFCDLTKDSKGVDTHGIFYAILDPKTFQLSGEMNFTYFTKHQLDQLFAKDNDKTDRKDKAFMQSKKKKKSEDESLSSDYVIEKVQSLDNNNIVLFCSLMYNYAVTTCDGKGNCHTNYYCAKSNVTAFKIDGAGKIIWASNLDRKITYSGWNIYDLRVVNKENKFIVAYGSDYSIKSDKKNRSSRDRKS